MTQDEQHLKLLSIFHYVVSGMSALFACLPILHVVFGLLFILAPDKIDTKGEPPPALIGWMFLVFGVVIIAIGWTFAALVLTVGRFLTRRRHYLFCLGMAGVECILMPYGTVLGVFTILVLMRPSVKQLFEADAV